jgi:hypothetical protein
MQTKNRWNTVFGILLTSLIIFIALFATPIIGSYSADILFEDALGCYVSSGLFDNHHTHHTCLFYGWDVSDKVAAYSTPILSFIITPYSFILAFYDVLIVWILMLFIAYKKSSPSPDRRNILNNIVYYIFLLFPFILVLLILASPATNHYHNYELRQHEQTQQQSPTLYPSNPNQNQHSGIRR